jgi:hypothetical protein
MPPTSSLDLTTVTVLSLKRPSTALSTALDRLKTEYRLQEILQAEPRLQPILEQAIFQETSASYDRILTYNRLRNQILPLVGFDAAHPDLRNSADYQLVIETLLDLLPPDRWDIRFPPPLLYRRI